MVNYKLKLYQRLYLEELLSNCEWIIENGMTSKKNIMLTTSQQNEFLELGSSLRVFLSSFENNVTIDVLATDYLDMKPMTVKRALARTGQNQFRIETLKQIISNSRQVANEQIGTIKELQKAVEEDKALVAN
ncbi:hypothetical protein ACFY6E_12395 [Staphylococcus cohnii]|uniref:hypothetical protein n=1 Tax=Staphylococcus cohnii TaxID=29382 RepID=UPI0036C2B257